MEYSLSCSLIRYPAHAITEQELSMYESAVLEEVLARKKVIDQENV